MSASGAAGGGGGGGGERSIAGFGGESAIGVGCGGMSANAGVKGSIDGGISFVNWASCPRGLVVGLVRVSTHAASLFTRRS